MATDEAGSARPLKVTDIDAGSLAELYADALIRSRTALTRLEAAALVTFAAGCAGLMLARLRSVESSVKAQDLVRDWEGREKEALETAEDLRRSQAFSDAYHVRKEGGG